ncbi:hypothetical protein D3C71_1995530 [compost metagenome]
MGFNATIGDNKQASVIADGHVMGADAMCIKLGNAPETVPRIIKADDTTIALKIVFAGVKNGTIGRKLPMPVKVPILRGVHDNGLDTTGGIEGHGKSTGPAGKRHSHA